MYFQYFILYNYFQLSLAVLFCYRSPHNIQLQMLIPPIHTALPNNTTLPLYLSTVGYHHILLLFPQDSRFSIYKLELPLELFLVRSPLLKKSKFVSSPVLNDMLKLRTYSCISASLQTHDIHHVYRILYVGLRLWNLSILYMS